jgi:predicted DNA-binding protein
MLTLRLDPEAEKLLKQFAAKSGQTEAEFARRAILDRLEDCEDYEAGISALRAPDSTNAIPLEEVVRSLGMEADFPPEGAKAIRKPGQNRAKTNPQVPPRKIARVA